MRKSDIIGLVLLAFAVGCRLWTPLADFYAAHCYPAISTVLSLAASAVPFSLEEIVVIGFVAAFIAILVRSIRRKAGFFSWLGRTARAAMWLVVWLNLGWACNYFRTPLYDRLGIEKASYDEQAFARFLTDYTEALNEAAGSAALLDKESLEAGIKDYYSTEVTAFGYTAFHKWQHVKAPLINRLYSAVGVLGFMGPFFCESQLNKELLEEQYPFTMAHELAHLAGVTSEAEANYWAYVYCRQSGSAEIRYSGHLALLPYISASAKANLPTERYDEWKAGIDSKVIEDSVRSSRYWNERRVGIIDKVQHWMMDRFLKSNGVAQGAGDYYGVVEMLMTMDGRTGQSQEFTKF
ncbi:MAG: DUF3810 domain-containing protein [Bacteroidales bacterium]|nr:DUF3810 domain-containing protein [Bacteroidales bacterium]